LNSFFPFAMQYLKRLLVILARGLVKRHPLARRRKRRHRSASFWATSAGTFSTWSSPAISRSGGAWHGFSRSPLQFGLGSALMDANSSLTVRVGRSGAKYIWQLYHEGIFEKVKYSGPFYKSEEFAMAAGLAGRTLYIARLKHQKQRRTH
jgi:hypothetical protein